MAYSVEETLLQDLNEPQREAVEHTEGPVLVLAGAGSGKTRVLTNRIGYLIGVKGVPPSAILAVTFTNKAAGEMKKRVEALVPEGIRGMWIGTFHSICMRILRREADLAGYTSDFTIYDRDDQKALMKTVLKDLDLSDKQYPPRMFISRISDLKNKLIEPESFASTATEFKEQKVARVYTEYQKRLRQNNAVDFDDLIMQTVLLFKRQPEVLERYRRRFSHVLVDEYQDTNHTQYTLVQQLGSAHRNVCVVGDDDQSIYGWRGADISNILDFDKDFPEAHVVKLEQNYRSTKTILRAAAEVIGNNNGRHEKELWSDLEEGEKLSLLETHDERDEAITIVEKIRLLRHQGTYTHNQMVVLYRTNAQSRALEEGLRRAGVPYAIVGSIRFYERKEIKDVLAYLKVIANPCDTVSLARIINVPRRQIGAATITRLEEFAFDQGITLAEAMGRAGEVPGVPGKKAQVLAGFRELLERYTARSKEMTVADLTSALLDEIGYMKEMETSTDPETMARLENIRELLVGMEDYQERAEDSSVKSFLAEVSLLTDVDGWDGEADRVTLMTLHCAKGLEFPVVFLAGLEEGLFPLAGAFESDDQMEEERRLFYVGLTRAKEKVFISSARHRRRYEQTLASVPSRFIDEIPAGIMEKELGVMAETYKTSRPPAAARPVSSGYGSVRPRQRSNPFAGGDDFDMDQRHFSVEVGSRVKHPSFGTGEVIMKRGVGEMTQVTVKFRSTGTKKLLLKFAKLSPA